MEKCNLQFMNRLNENKILTKNKTIINYAVDYVKSFQVEPGIIEVINQVRINLQLLLLLDFLG